MQQDDRDPQGVAHDEPAPPGAELLERIKQIGEELAGVFREGAHLVGAESRLFASTLLLIATLAVALGFIVAGAVLLLGFALILVLVRQAGVDPVIAVLIVMAVLVGLAAATGMWIRGLTRHLRFNESRRMLARISASGKNGREGEAE